MKLLGHHVDPSTATRVSLDALLFFIPLAWLGSPQACALCGHLALPSLAPYQALGIALALILLAGALGLYNADAAHDLRTYLKRFLVSWELIALAALLLAAAGGLALGAGPRGLPIALAAGAAAVMSTQLLLRLALGWWSARPSHRRRVLVLGETASAEKIADFLRGAGRKRFEHLRTLASRSVAGPLRAGSLRLAGAPAAEAPLPELAQALGSHEIVVACEDRQALPVDELLECKLRGIEVVDALDFWEREAGVVEVARSAGAWLALSEGLRIGAGRRAAKRMIDVTASLVLLVLAAPLCLLVALAIRLEGPGPLFYRQERVGLNGVVFKVWKFRSMRPDAEHDGVARWAASGDNRVTRVGRFIRKVRIDEIPQVLNVLAGEMSFIGPRPERPAFVEQLRQQIPYYDLRHRVPPGITGWAQVNYPYGASAEDARRKLAYDLYYLKRGDLLLDLLILLQTVRVVLFAHGGR